MDPFVEFNSLILSDRSFVFKFSVDQPHKDRES